jgi:hypothetical protein
MVFMWEAIRDKDIKLQRRNVEFERVVVHDENRGFRHHARGFARRSTLCEF